jgi:hypothetical protein
VEIDENPFLLAICPSCGKPMKMPKGSKEQEEDKMHCEELSSNPVAIPTGVRTMPDNLLCIWTETWSLILKTST